MGVKETSNSLDARFDSDFTRMAYNKYQLNWLISHNFSVSDFYSSVEMWVQEQLLYPNETITFEEYLFENGFSGCIWACYLEFLGAEYLDDEYMKSILTADEYEVYRDEV